MVNGIGTSSAVATARLYAQARDISAEAVLIR